MRKVNDKSLNKNDIGRKREAQHNAFSNKVYSHFALCYVVYVFAFLWSLNVTMTLNDLS